MTIRYTLLISYLLISLVAALFITITTFLHFREMLRLEIENKLKSQASTIMQQIDTTLFERLENMAMWSGLEIMQETTVRDVDKRLSNYLNGLHEGYGGIYQQIFVVDQQEEIIAASDAKLIGQTNQLAPAWLTVNYKNQLQTLTLDKANNNLVFSIAINNSFATANLGHLYAGFDWQETIKLLDAPLPFSSKDAPSYALLVDSTGAVIATSSQLPSNNLPLQQLPEILAQLPGSSGSLMMPSSTQGNETILAGYAVSEGFRNFHGFGWRVLILQPSKNALAPVSDLWIAILVLLSLTIFLAVLMAFWMSAKIAKPIVQLADFTRGFMQGKQTLPPKIHASREITQLSEQFSLMVANLEQSKQDLIRASKLAVIGEMAATMAHEVRTPLGILLSSAEILQREPKLTDIGQEMTEFIISETARLNALITTLLACAKPQQPAFIRQDISKTIKHCLELLQHQADSKQIHLALEYAETPIYIEFDHDLMLQVFLNLLMNAIQHVNQGGKVVVCLQASELAVAIDINDNGVGISDDNKAKVFEPFFTQRRDGIGLGLTVVQQIIHAHRGKITVTDSSYGGASFQITLPLTQSDNSQ